VALTTLSFVTGTGNDPMFSMIANITAVAQYQAAKK
jgi:hypothetical protein